MAINSLSTGFRPGVCTSGTRPTAPYEGQQIYETDTDLSYVWNGSAWVGLTGPTATAGTNTTQLATTEFANAAGGLVFIKSQVIGSGVTSVTVTGAFSATYDNYLILMNGTSSTADDNGRMTLGSANTGYYGNLLYATPSSPGTFLGASDNNGGNFAYIWRSYSGGSANISVGTPFLAQKTTVRGDWITTAANGTYTGVQASSTSFTSFTLTCAAGALTGGTISVYGYRK
jgi:hypothetical protein